MARMRRKERKENKGQREKDGDESLCFRKGRKGCRGKEGKDSEERILMVHSGKINSKFCLYPASSVLLQYTYSVVAI